MSPTNRASSPSFRSPLPALALALAACGRPAEEPDSDPLPAEAAQPPLLVISLDTLRADRLGCYGYERPTSPTVDSLAAAGVLFEDVASPSAKTATSHMSMFTGLHPGVHGVRNTYGGTAFAPHQELITIFQAAKRDGYVTAGFTGGGMMSAELGFGRGFDLYDARGGGGDRVFARASKWLEAEAAVIEDEPVALLVHTYEIHDPYTPPALWRERFVDPRYAGAIDPTRVELPIDAAETWKKNPQFYTEVQDRFWGGRDGASAADMAFLSDLYDAGIAYTDSLLGEFLDQVSETRLGQEGLIVLTSDHGDEFSEHGNVTHQSIYQEILHVPLVFRLPPGDPDATARAGSRIQRPVRGIDLGPSLADWCGVALSEQVQGISLLPEVRGGLAPDLPTWSEIGSVANELASYRKGSYKLIARKAENGLGELYDLDIDRAERFNRREAYPEKFEEFRSELDRFVQAHRELAVRFPPGVVEMGAEALGALQALGYTEKDAEEN